MNVEWAHVQRESRKKLGGKRRMATRVKEMARQALDKLADDEAVEVLDFIGYLRWRQEEMDQTWFWTGEWQTRYREAEADLVEGRFQNSDDIEDLLAELKS